jgi:serralysin
MPTFNETTDAAGSTATTYTLTAGSTFGGTITAGDHDFVGVYLNAGQTYTFSMVATGAGGSRLSDTVLTLRDQNGVTITTNDDGGPGRNSTITFTTPFVFPYVGSVYYLDAQGYAPTQSGTYTLTETIGSRASYDLTAAAGAELVSGAVWNGTAGTPTTVTYGFRESAASYAVAGSNISTFSQVSASERATTQQLLTQWSDVCGLSFQEVNPGGFTDSATLLIGNYNDATDGAGAFAYFPGDTTPDKATQAGDLWLNIGGGISTGSQPLDTYSRFVIMHELGHAIGLSHPGDYNASPGGSLTYANSSQFIQDSQQYSVMSYFNQSNTGSQYAGYADTPMMNDIYAAQQLYGANYTTRAGNTTYGYNSTAGSVYDLAVNTSGGFCIWDGGGNDSLDASGSNLVQTINLTDGTFSSVNGATANVSIAYGAIIENAFGGGGVDTITGNVAANYVDGCAGNDTIFGGLGNDVLFGALGNDTHYGGDGNDYIDGGAGDDYIDGDLGNDLLYGGAGADNLYAGDGNDLLYGGLGLNRLDGGVGNDILDNQAADARGTLYGGDGDDFAYASNSGDLIYGGAGSDNITGGTGNDTLYAGEVSGYSVAGLDFVYGAAGNDNLYGGYGTSFLYGGDGNDNLQTINNTGTSFLYGGAGVNVFDGGYGVDYLFGGNGTNTFNGGFGNDFVLSQGQTGPGDIAYGGSGGDYLFMGEGDDQAYGGDDTDVFHFDRDNKTDVIFGGGGNDIMNGGAGQDYLWGGAGADQFQLLNSISTDVVYDWDTGSDRIQVASSMYANFAAINAGHIGYSAASNTTVVFTADSSAYLILLNTNSSTLTAANFNFV